MPREKWSREYFEKRAQRDAERIRRSGSTAAHGSPDAYAGQHSAAAKQKKDTEKEAGDQAVPAADTTSQMSIRRVG